jgi:hypothetical protein
MIYKGLFGGTVTSCGLKLDVVKSALQKYIRRGNFQKAWFCAVQLDEFNDLPEAKVVITNFTNRLKVILTEDCFDNFNLHALGYSLIESYIKEKSILRISYLYNVIRLMCFMKKGRMASHLRATYYSVLSHPQLLQKYHNTQGLPPYQQAQQFRDLLVAKDFNCFYYLYQCYYNHKPDIKSLFRVLEELLKRKDVMDLYYHLFRTVGNSEEKPMFIVYPTLLLIHPELLSEIKPFNTENLSGDQITSLLTSTKNSPLTLDEFVIDKHTKQGKTEGKNALHFALEGSVVTNENSLINKEYQLIYNDVKASEISSSVSTKKQTKKKINKPVLECLKIKDIEFIETCSITVCGNKPVTFKVRYNDKFYVLKLLNKINYGLNSVRISELKKENSLPFVETKICCLNFLLRRKDIINKFVKDNYVIENDNKEHNYLMMEYFDGVPLKHIENWHENPHILSQYVENGIFSYIWGVSDWNNNNILINKNNDLLRIDEMDMFKDVKLFGKVQKKIYDKIFEKKEFISQTIKRFSDQINLSTLSTNERSFVESRLQFLSSLIH